MFVLFVKIWAERSYAWNSYETTQCLYGPQYFRGFFCHPSPLFINKQHTIYYLYHNFSFYLLYWFIAFNSLKCRSRICMVLEFGHHRKVAFSSKFLCLWNWIIITTFFDQMALFKTVREILQNLVAFSNVKILITTNSRIVFIFSHNMLHDCDSGKCFTNYLLFIFICNSDFLIYHFDGLVQERRTGVMSFLH